MFFCSSIVRSFCTAFTPGVFHAIQVACALVERSGTSPVSETVSFTGPDIDIGVFEPL